MQSEAISDTLYVPLEYPFLQDAVNAAQEGDVIEVSAGEYSSATINGSTQCTMTIQARTVDGVGDDVIISALQVSVGNCSNISASGLTIGDLQVTNTNTVLNISSCSISRLYTCCDAILNATDCMFEFTEADSEITSGAAASFQNCTFEHIGQGWKIRNGSTASFMDCSFNFISMYQFGFDNSYSELQIMNSELTGNMSPYAGILNSGQGSSSLPSLDLFDVKISGFSAGISHQTPSGFVLADGCTIENNSGPGNLSGGIYISGSQDVSLNNTIIRNNQSSELGGGLYITSANSVSIRNCEISNNTADNYGGGMLISASNVTIEGTQICSNLPDQVSGLWEDLGGNIESEFCPCPDCNNNGISDCEDIGTGSSSDLNGNNIPDECDPDCDSDGFPDFIEIDQGELDCNRNGVPDFCEVFLEEGNDTNTNGIHDDCESDCNANGVFDFIDISNADSIDSDENGIPDECDQCADSPDCNQNGEADACEIVFGDTVDINMNLVPDECECVCDVVPNGSVDFSDAILVISSWGPCAAPCPADIVADGEVRYEDLIRVFSNWGPCP